MNSAVPEPAAADDLGAVLAELDATIQARRGADPGSSYVASLLAKGTDAVLKKVGEEAAEVLIAAKNGIPAPLVGELADLWFHCLVLMAERQSPLSALSEELARRRGRSGIEEKASRQPG